MPPLQVVDAANVVRMKLDAHVHANHEKATKNKNVMYEGGRDDAYGNAKNVHWGTDCLP